MGLGLVVPELDPLFERIGELIQGAAHAASGQRRWSPSESAECTVVVRTGIDWPAVRVVTVVPTRQKCTAMVRTAKTPPPRRVCPCHATR